MIYKRRYVQFNDLVFDGYDMISESSSDTGFKDETHEYSYTHGSYVAFKKPYMFAEETEIDMTIKLKMKKLPCQYREFYRSYVIGELTKPGKLWAVQNNELVWAYAYITNYSESEDSLENQLEIDVNFKAYEGIWHKADKQKTFITEYDVCEFMACEKFETVDYCQQQLSDGTCCAGCLDSTLNGAEETCECCCDGLTTADSLCAFKDMQKFYDCLGGYKITYDCAKAQELFGDEYLGYKICKEWCDPYIIGKFYSDTDIPTKGVKIRINGKVEDATITINDNTNIIKGEYEGLVIYPNGDVYEAGSCNECLLDPSVWVIPSGNDYGWEVHRGNNRITINSCCGDALCAYVEVDSLTI